MRVAIAADHAGTAIRDDIAAVIRSAGHYAIVLGNEINGPEDDYPRFAKLVGDAIAEGRADRGILICGSGAGVTVAANKLPGVRAALASDVYTAHQMVEHDYCNVMTLGARTIGPDLAREFAGAFVNAEFLGESRHRRRLGEVIQLEREQHINPCKGLHEAGQSIWLDNIRHALLTSGTLARYISSLWVTGLTSNPTIFEHAITGSSDYDESILKRLDQDLSTEQLFFEIAIEDIVAAAELLRPVFEATAGADGFVSLEVSPDLADDAKGTITEAKHLHAEAARPNVLIKVPGTKAGSVAIEELIFAGIPINVTLLFSCGQYLTAAEAYMRGIERRHKAGINLDVASVASIFISRWDAKSASKLPVPLRNKLGIAIGQRTFKAFRDLLASQRWQRLARAGARPQRLLWASTGVKDPTLPDTHYVTALAANQTVNTLPEATLLAFAHHGKVGALLSEDPANAEAVLADIGKAGVDVDAMAEQLQIEGCDAFSDSFSKLLASIDVKKTTLREVRDGMIERLGPRAIRTDSPVADLNRRENVTPSNASRNDCSPEGIGGCGRAQREPP